MPVVIFLACLDLEQKFLFMDGHSLGFIFDQIKQIFKGLAPRITLVYLVRLEGGWMDGLRFQLPTSLFELRRDKTTQQDGSSFFKLFRFLK